MTYGRLVDYSYSHPTPAAVAGAGYLGAMRYLSFDGPPKNLTAAERDALHSAGLGIGLVWEATASAPLGGYQRGTADAARANSQADALDYPPHLPIFFAVDFEPTTASMPYVLDYFRAIIAASPRPVGAYGPYAAIEALHAAPVRPTHYWQCIAWSHGYLSAHAHLFQRFGYVLGDTSDENDILQPPDWLWYPEEGPMALDPDVQGAFDTLAANTLKAVIQAEQGTAAAVVALLDERDNSVAVTAVTAIIGHIDAGNTGAARKVAIDLVTRLAPPGEPVPT